MDRRVVITGIGLITPIGTGKDAFWKSVSNGVSGVSLIEKFDTKPYRTKIAAQIKSFDPSSHLTPQMTDYTDIVSQYALVAAKEAIEDSKFKVADDSRKRVGVIWGSSEGAADTKSKCYESFVLKGPMSIDPMLLPKGMSAASAALIAIENGYTGHNCTISNTCSSSAVSVGDGYRLIKHGYADVVIAGGSEAPVIPFMLSGWCKLRALSTRNDEPEKAVRPFSKGRDGPVLGEGGGGL